MFQATGATGFVNNTTTESVCERLPPMRASSLVFSAKRPMAKSHSCNGSIGQNVNFTTPPPPPGSTLPPFTTSGSPLRVNPALPSSTPTANRNHLQDSSGGEKSNGSGTNTNWEREKCKAAHISYLQIATPVDQLPRIDAQLVHSMSSPNTPSSATPTNRSMIKTSIISW